ncbi:uncharacterized protein [Procambarus clarkii]|uniref:uncharacterized protein n=1 Tax=Procambarus clarkii TaxID=6728 RepID=UPI003743403B
MEEVLVNEETPRGDEAEDVGGDTHTTALSAPGSTWPPAGDAGTTPTASPKAIGCGCTSTVIERGRSETGAPRSPELTGGANTSSPDVATSGTAARSKPGTSTERESAGESTRTDKRGK